MDAIRNYGRIARLSDLAENLWWSWHPQARDYSRSSVTAVA